MGRCQRKMQVITAAGSGDIKHFPHNIYAGSFCGFQDIIHFRKRYASRRYLRLPVIPERSRDKAAVFHFRNQPVKLFQRYRLHTFVCFDAGSFQQIQSQFLLQPSGKKLLTFKIESTDVTPGQSIALSIGERAVDYDMVVPNSAIKTGTTSKFVLAVKSKSSPLGNRYIATKVDVDVVASDDNYSAITAALDGDEFVITTSNKPVKAGEQVRLANE